jgi:hypothetical protein
MRIRAPILEDVLPMPTAQPAKPVPNVRCIQRPTGEWFTMAPTNAPGKDTPDATELWTEAETRDRLAELGHAREAIDEILRRARETPEVSGDIAEWPEPPPAPVDR